MEGNDMITNLYRLPKLEDRKDTIQIKRAFVGDKGAILNFIKRRSVDPDSHFLFRYAKQAAADSALSRNSCS